MHPNHCQLLANVLQGAFFCVFSFPTSNTYVKGSSTLQMAFFFFSFETRQYILDILLGQYVWLYLMVLNRMNTQFTEPISHYRVFWLVSVFFLSQTHSFFFFFGLFAISWAPPAAFGGSQARGRIGAVSCMLRLHSLDRPFVCKRAFFFFWLHSRHTEVLGPGIEPEPQQ